MDNIVVIPVYKQNMSDDELLALKQCIKILSAHDIALVCPQSLNINQYKTVFQQCEKQFSVARFDNSFFNSLDSYSELCLSECFYKRFENYTYMLIYQLDCWVFDDRLQYWCDMGYDYVGAPWSQKNQRRLGLNGHPVGNGGLSLRKISTMIKLCSSPINQQTVQLPVSFKVFYNKHKKRRTISMVLNFPIVAVKYLVQKNYDYSKNEDIVIASYANRYIPEFLFPDMFTAARFSIETAPKYFFEKIGGLPFGTHGWNKPQHIKFWQRFIKT